MSEPQTPVVKLRAVQFQIQPMIVADDGTNLTLVEVAPMLISAAELDEFPEAFRRQIAEQESKLNDPRS